MIDTLVQYIQQLIFAHGAWGVFVATLIEEIIAPVPSPIVAIAGGFFLLPGDGVFLEIAVRALLLVALPVTVGIAIGSVVVYGLGYVGGKPLIEKTKRWTGIHWSDIEKLERYLARGRRDEVSLFVLRIIPLIPGVAISGFCGMVRYSFKTFFVITVLGAFVRAWILAILGWQVGELYVLYADAISRVEKVLLLFALVSVLMLCVRYGMLRYRRVQNQDHKKVT